MRTFPWVYVGDDDDNDDNSGHVKQHSYSVCVMRYTHCMKTFGWLVGWFVCSPAGRTFYTRWRAQSLQVSAKSRKTANFKRFGKKNQVHSLCRMLFSKEHLKLLQQSEQDKDTDSRTRWNPPLGDFFVRTSQCVAGGRVSDRINELRQQIYHSINGPRWRQSRRQSIDR